jgi:hypothetical protein
MRPPRLEHHGPAATVNVIDWKVWGSMALSYLADAIQVPVQVVSLRSDAGLSGRCFVPIPPNCHLFCGY